MASIRLIPEETEDSDMILNIPKLAVDLAWVPPHNSIEYFLSKITTLTFSPYFHQIKT